jgi:type I restriction enzyme S subunit
MVRSVRLADISSLITKGTTPTTLGFDFQETGINFLKIECFEDNGTFIPEKVAHISSECHDKLKRSQLQSGDILFSIAGAIGRVSIVTEEMLPANTNQALAIIRIDNPEVYIPYIKLVLHSPVIEKQFERKKQGVAQLNLSLNDINGLTIPLPSLSQQIEYVKLFNKIESIIANRKYELNFLDDLIKARFVEMFGGLENTIRLGDCCEVHARIGWQALTKDEHKPSGDYMLVTGTDFIDGKVNYYMCVYVEKERYEMDPHIILKENDVLITKDGTIGKVAVVHSLPKPATLNAGIFVVRPDERFNKEYISFVFRGPLFEKFVELSKTGATIKHLNQKHLVEFMIPVPTMKEQEKFAEFSKQVDKSKFAVQQALDKAQLLFDSLMQKYFG